jgi:predicted RNase H-like HicB family nuclease
MPIRYFTGIIEAGKTGYGVYFPDLPGCVSAGKTVEDAARNAEEALSLHLRGMIEDGDELPPATAPERIRTTRGSVEVARFLVRGEAPSKSVRLNISLDKTLIAKIDRAAKTRSMTRSGFIAQAATRALEDAD